MSSFLSGVKDFGTCLLSKLKAFGISLLEVSVLWFLIVIAAGGGAGAFVASCVAQTPRDNNSNSSTRYDSNFYQIISQSVLAIVASYCTLIPILQANVQPTVPLKTNNSTLRSWFHRQKPSDDGLVHENTKIHLSTKVVFYFSVLATTATAVAAPIAYVTHQGSYQNVANGLGFASSFFAAVTTSQLAGASCTLNTVTMLESFQVKVVVRKVRGTLFEAINTRLQGHIATELGTYRGIQHTHTGFSTAQSNLTRLGDIICAHQSSSCVGTNVSQISTLS